VGEVSGYVPNIVHVTPNKMWGRSLRLCSKYCTCYSKQNNVREMSQVMFQTLYMLLQTKCGGEVLGCVPNTVLVTPNKIMCGRSLRLCSKYCTCYSI